jgi:hypothetical protein
MEVAVENQPRLTDDIDPGLREKIQERAYYLWIADGRPEGAQLEYWLRAEEEFLGGMERDRGGRAGDEPGLKADYL